MAIKNPFQDLQKVKTSHARNAFDLSYRYLHMSSCGLLTPFYVKDVKLGDKVKLNLSATIRSIQMQSMSFQRLRAHFDYFFVPYRLLWRWYPEFQLNIMDRQSTNGYYSDSDDVYKKTPRVMQTLPRTNTYLIRKALKSGIGSSAVEDWRKDDMGYDLYHGAQRLFESFRLNPWIVGAHSQLSTDAATDKDFDVNIFRFLAYQKIYSDHYRNTDYENLDPYAFNVDWITGDSTTTAVTPNPEWFKIRYATWKRDYATSLKPQINYLGFNNSSSSLYDFEPYINAFYTGLNSSASSITVNAYGFTSALNTPYGSAFSLSSLRNAYALERLSMISERAKKRYSSQYQARYGETVSKKDDNYSTRIGSKYLNIGIQEVTSTADSGDRGLGAIGAKSYGELNDNKAFDFDVHEDGIIMGIEYIEPLVDYLSNSVDPFFRKLTPGDFWQPEFDNLGMQPLYSMDVADTVHDINSVGGTIYKNQNVLGWQPRYMEYKTAIDIVGESFHDSYASWVSPRIDILNNPGATSVGVNFLNVYRYFHIDPGVLNPIFYTAYTGETDFDQFLIEMYNRCTLISNMSSTGTPRV